MLKRAARSRDENTTLSETVVAEAINSLEGEREVRAKPARVFPSSMLALHFLFYLFIHNTCVALHFPPCSSFSLFLFFSTGKVQVKSSDIQVGDLIIVEKVCDF